MGKISFILLIPILAILSCGNGRPQKFQFEEIHMDTVFQVVLYSNNPDLAKKSASEVFAQISNIERCFSVTKADSYLSILNKSGIFRDPSPEFLSVLRDSISASKETGGAFDVSVEPVVELWGFYNQKFRLPQPSAVKNTLRLVDYRNISVSEAGIRLNRKIRIDLGGILKGYSVDKGVELLRSKGIAAGLVNAGGNLKVFGKKPDGKDWTIGIKHPRKSEVMFSVISLSPGMAISTSGDYERFFITNNTRYHHIIDPKTGYPARNGLISVSVIYPSAESVDYLSTALFVMGPEKALAFAESKKIAVLLIMESNSVVYSTNSSLWKK